ncbi:glycine-rich domain-containing protein [Atlantibacter hermannii]|uniref:glycine-rich domain-containing protein n=1 Tax=Atlantibacter hermannii TaxID=565 RepID=UPI0028A87D12|nr:hypothetical protein [Atlantibacter hermannii]
MQISNLPKLLPVPFANSGSKQDIPVASQIGVSGGRASYTDGFPPLTRTPIAAGGIPPFGTDFNGVLNDITSAIRWAQAGGGYGYDSTFSSGVSGYPIGARLANSTGDGYWLNTVDGNTNNPETSAATPLTGWVPSDSYGVTSVTGLGSSSVTLSTLQASRDRIVLTGTLTANINVIVPAWRKSWTVVNNCSGAFTVTFKTTSGAGVSIPAGFTAEVVCDGTDIYQDTTILGVPGRLLGAPKVFVTSGSYTPAANVKAIVVEIVGGGGGGGAAQSSANYNAAGGGGGGGGYAKKYIPLSSTAAIAYTVGLGGNGATYPASNGQAGGTTTFGSGFSATGGNGGNTAISNAGSSLVGAGGGGGTASGGNINSTGGGGQGGVSASPSLSGGSVAGGYGGVSVISGQGGAGGGGQGATTSTGNQTINGNRGNDGMVIIWEYA